MSWRYLSNVIDIDFFCNMFYTFNTFYFDFVFYVTRSVLRILIIFVLTVRHRASRVNFPPNFSIKRLLCELCLEMFKDNRRQVFDYKISTKAMIEIQSNVICMQNGFKFLFVDDQLTKCQMFIRENKLVR